MVTKIDRMFVYPEFKRKIKAEAALKGLSVIKYTKKLSGSKSLEEEFKESSKDEGFKYKW